MYNQEDFAYNEYNEPYFKNGKEYPPFLKFVKGAIPLEVIKIMDIEYSMMKNCMETMKNCEGFNDPTVPNSFSWYSPLCFEALSEYIKPIIEKQVGAELHSTYSYSRIYMNGSELVKHTDRKSSQLSASCCIRKEDHISWPLYFKISDSIIGYDMDPGDLVIASGSVIPHWREKYTGNEHMQAFLQYVYADGKYQHLKYDTRPCMAAPYDTVQQWIIDEVERRKIHPLIT